MAGRVNIAAGKDGMARHTRKFIMDTNYITLKALWQAN